LIKIQEDYNETNGGKWSLKNLLTYLKGVYGKVTVDTLMEKIDAILIHSLK
jgi:tubulin polyglutamylase TTLL1